MKIFNSTQAETEVLKNYLEMHKRVLSLVLLPQVGGDR
jgi:hypothetical protein